jgi:uncharacterized protein YigA (DUF484 family)
VNTPANPNIAEDEIVRYLVNTPDFFVRHSDLLATVEFTSPHSRRTVSLQERQAELLREKIKLLEQRFVEMIRNGNENAVLTDKIMRFAQTLLAECGNENFPDRLADKIQTRFSVPQVGIRVWGVAPAYQHLGVARAVSEDVQVFANSLTEPFCGLNTGFEAVAWLPEPAAVTSLALIPLCGQGPAAAAGAFGLLVCASMDPQRFDSGMGTEFLARIGELTSAALARLR